MVARKKPTATEVTTDPSKIEVVRLSVPCGWCMTNQHEDCKPELVYPPKNWICGCKVCNMADYIPKVGVEASKKAVAPVEVETEDEDGA